MKEQEIYKKEKNRQSGFTMVEMIATVAILIILMAFGSVAVISHMHNLKFTEMNNHARELFIAAQNHLTESKAVGDWEKVYAQKAGDTAFSGEKFNRAADTTYPADQSDTAKLNELKKDRPVGAGLKDTDGNEYLHDWRYVTISSGEINANTFDADQSVLGIMLPFGSIDDTLRSDGTYVIEYDAMNAQIYGVFYTEEKITGANLETAVTKMDAVTDKQYRLDDVSRENKGEALSRFRFNFAAEGLGSGRFPIGYYGGASAYDQSHSLADPQIALKIVNGPRLLLVMDVKADAEYRKKIEGLEDEELKLSLIDQENHEIVLDKVKYDTLLTAQNLNSANVGHENAINDLAPIDGYFNGVAAAGDAKTDYMRYVYILDSVVDGNTSKSRHFSRFCGDNGLALGSNIYASVSIGDDDPIARSNTANSLYATSSDWSTKTASIKNGRHLENLSDEISAFKNGTALSGSGVVTATIDRPITWHTADANDDFFDDLSKEASAYKLDPTVTQNSDHIRFAGSAEGQPNHYYGIYSKTLRTVNGKKNKLSNLQIAASQEVTDAVHGTTSMVESEKAVTSGQFTGLISWIELNNSETVKLENVIVKNPTYSSSTNVHSTGGLIGYHSIGSLTIEHSTVTSDNDLALQGGKNVGGLVGYAKISGTLTLSDTEVSGTNSIQITGSGETGGAVGKIEGNSSNQVRITDSNVTSKNVQLQSTGSKYAGGFIGGSYKNSLTILRAGVTGGTGVVTKSGNLDGGYVDAGGFIGGIEGNGSENVQITDSFASIRVNNQAAHGNAGGFIGQIWNVKNFDINRCYAAGRTTASSYDQTQFNVSGSRSVGGFIGLVVGIKGNDSSIQHSYTTCSVYRTNTNTEQDSGCGGFIGSTYRDIASNYSISNCYSSGLVKSDYNKNAGLFIGLKQSSNGTGEAKRGDQPNFVLRGISGNISQITGTAATDDIAQAVSANSQNGPFHQIDDPSRANTAAPMDQTLVNNHKSYTFKTTAELANLSATGTGENQKNQYNHLHVGDWAIAKVDETNIKLETGNKLTLTFELDSTEEYASIQVLGQARANEDRPAAYALIHKKTDGTLEWSGFKSNKNEFNTAQATTVFQHGFTEPIAASETEGAKTKYTIWLDDLTINGGNVYSLFSSGNNKDTQIQPGEDISVRVASGSTTNFEDSQEVTKNTLFERIEWSAEKNGYIAHIANSRHLQNLDRSANGTAWQGNNEVINIVGAVQDCDIQWQSSGSDTALKNRTYQPFIEEITELNAKVGITTPVVILGTAYSGHGADYANQFLAIGNETNPLRSYDGQNHTIDHLNLVNGNGKSHAGLFGYTKHDMSVKNLILTNVTAEGSNSAGALFGTISGGVIEVKNVDIGGSSIDIKGGNHAGGLIGEMTIANDQTGSLTVNDIHVYAKDGMVQAENGTNAGGLIGLMNGLSAEMNQVENTSASVLVKTKGYAGGLIGNISNSKLDITDSYVGGHTLNGNYRGRQDNITATETWGHAGGFLSTVTGSEVHITNCYSTASVKANHAGGFISSWPTGVQIENAYATGLVSVYDKINGGYAGAFAGTSAVTSDTLTNRYLLGVNSGDIKSSGNGVEVAKGVTWDTLAQTTQSGLAYRYDETISSHIYPLISVGTPNNGVAHYGDWSSVRLLEISYTITFKDSDKTELGSFTVKQDESLTNEQLASIHPKFEEGNKKFSGWYLENGTAPVDDAIFRQVRQDITVYAHYTDYISFMYKDPTDPSAETVELANYPVTNGKVQVPTRNEYIGDKFRFNGWWTTPVGDGSKITVINGMTDDPHVAQLFARYDPVGYNEIRIHFQYQTSENGKAETFDGSSVADEFIYQLKETEALGTKTVVLPSVREGVYPIQIYRLDGNQKQSIMTYKQSDKPTSFTITVNEKKKNIDYYVLYEGIFVDYKVIHVFHDTAGTNRTIPYSEAGNADRHVRQNELDRYQNRSTLKITEERRARLNSEVSFESLILSDVQAAGFRADIPGKITLEQNIEMTVEYSRRTFMLSYDVDGGEYLEPEYHVYGDAIGTLRTNTQKAGSTLNTVTPWEFSVAVNRGSHETEATAKQAGIDAGILNADGSSKKGKTIANMPACDVVAKAQWNQNTTAKIKINVMQQKDTAKWEETNEQKAENTAARYDFIRSVEINDSFEVGKVPSDTLTQRNYIINALNRVGLPTGTQDKQIGQYQFHLNRELTFNVAKQEKVKADGETVFVVYYDRKIITVKFLYPTNVSQDLRPPYHKYPGGDNQFVEITDKVTGEKPKKGVDKWWTIDGIEKFGHYSPNNEPVTASVKFNNQSVTKYYLYEYTGTNTRSNFKYRYTSSKRNLRDYKEVSQEYYLDADIKRETSTNTYIQSAEEQAKGYDIAYSWNTTYNKNRITARKETKNTFNPFNGDQVEGKDDWYGDSFGHIADGVENDRLNKQEIILDSEKQQLMYGLSKSAERYNVKINDRNNRVQSVSQDYLVDIWIGLSGESVKPEKYGYEWNNNFAWFYYNDPNQVMGAMNAFTQDAIYRGEKKDNKAKPKLNYYIQKNNIETNTTFNANDFEFKFASELPYYASPSWNTTQDDIDGAIPGFTQKYYSIITDNSGRTNPVQTLNGYQISFYYGANLYYVRNRYDFIIGNIEWDLTDAKVKSLMKYLEAGILYEKSLDTVYDRIYDTLFDRNTKKWRGVAWPKGSSKNAENPYKFIQFGKSSGESAKWDGKDETMPAYTFQIFAQWQKPQYDVSFDPFQADTDTINALKESDAVLHIGDETIKLKELPTNDLSSLTKKVEKDQTIADALTQMPYFEPGSLPDGISFDYWAYRDGTGANAPIRRFVEGTKLQKNYQLFAVWKVKKKLSYKIIFVDEATRHPVKTEMLREDGVLGEDYDIDMNESDYQIKGFSYVGYDHDTTKYSSISGKYTEDMLEKPICLIYRRGAYTWDYMKYQTFVYRDIDGQHKIELPINSSEEHTDRQNEVVLADTVLGYVLSDDAAYVENASGQQTLERPTDGSDRSATFYYEISERMLNVSVSDLEKTYNGQPQFAKAEYVPLIENAEFFKTEDYQLTTEIHYYQNNEEVMEPKHAGIYEVATDLILEKKDGSERYVLSHQMQNSMVIKRKAAILESNSYVCDWNEAEQAYLPPEQEVHQTGFIGDEGVIASFEPNLRAVEGKVVDNLFTYTAKEGTNLSNYSITCRYGYLTTAEPGVRTITFLDLYERPNAAENWEALPEDSDPNEVWKETEDPLTIDVTGLLKEDSEAGEEGDNSATPEEKEQARLEHIATKLTELDSSWPSKLISNPAYQIDGYQFDGWGIWITTEGGDSQWVEYTLRDDPNQTSPQHSLESDLKAGTLQNQKLYAHWTKLPESTNP